MANLADVGPAASANATETPEPVGDRSRGPAEMPATTPSPWLGQRVSNGHLPAGMPLAEVLQSPTLVGARVVAGRAGLGRTVQRLNVMEGPDILPWVKPGELLLTAGYPLRDRPGGLGELVVQLDARGLAGLMVKEGRYLDSLPDDLLSEADRLGLPVVSLPPAVAFDDVLNAVLTDILNRQAALLMHADEVHRRLVQVVLGGGGLQEVADEMVAVLGGAVLATSADGRVLCHSDGGVALSGLRSSPLFDEAGRFRSELYPVGAHLLAEPPLSLVVVPIVAGSHDHGRLVALRAAPLLGDADVQALERAATVAALAITKAQAVSAVEEKYRGDFLRDLVGGRANDPAVALSHCRSLGWDIDRPVVVVVAELDPAPPASRAPEGLAMRPAQDRLARAWEAAVRSHDSGAPVAGFAHEVVAVLSGADGAAVDDLVHEVTRRISGDAAASRRSFSTGVSRVCGGVSEIPRAYDHARKAMLVGRRTRGNGSVAHFDSLGVFRLLSLVDDTDELRGFVRETLKDLAQRDDAEAADLRRTLQVLLEMNLNVAETARTLHFHYNTLRYRIGKLERMLGPFTTDPHLRLNLTLALQVAQMPGV
jgi:purine catabolism regulator